MVYWLWLSHSCRFGHVNGTTRKQKPAVAYEAKCVISMCWAREATVLTGLRRTIAAWISGEPRLCLHLWVNLSKRFSLSNHLHKHQKLIMLSLFQKENTLNFEKKRIETRLENSKKNDVWRYRTEPPKHFDNELDIAPNTNQFSPFEVYETMKERRRNRIPKVRQDEQPADDDHSIWLSA